VANYFLYRLGQFIAVNLPLKWAYAVAVLICDLRYAFAWEDRRAVRDNLKVIFPDKPEREIRRIRIGMFRNFAKYLVDFFRFEKLDKDFIRKNIHLQDLDNFDRGLTRGKGAIVLTAHLGNWELGGVVMALLGYPLWAVALPHKEKKVNDFFNGQRQSKGLNVIPLGRAVRQCLNLLRENKMVALVGDRDFTEKGITVNFFGRPAFFPEGPAAFSLKTGACIVPGFMVRNPDDSFSLRIERPIEFTPGQEKEKDIRQLVGIYQAIIEKYIRLYPDQWYMFRRFWKQ
jgi:KDO2-lipid IV(A) lauroyltransferase